MLWAHCIKFIVKFIYVNTKKIRWLWRFFRSWFTIWRICPYPTRFFTWAIR